MTKDVESGLDRTRAVLSTLRKALQEVEQARGAVTSLILAAARGDENQAALMQGLINELIGKLGSKVAGLQVSMDVVAKAAAPEPVKVVKPKAA